MQISSVVASGSANFSAGLRLSSQSRPISRDYPSSLCCKLNVEKLNIRSAGQRGQARRCSTCVVKATTDDSNNPTHREDQSSYRPLYRGIGENGNHDGETSMEDKMYRLVVKKFVTNGISMLPDLYQIVRPTIRVDFWLNKFRGIHSRAAFEMILSHIYVRGQQFTDGPILKITNIRLRDLYAHSVIYGYYLGKVEEMYRYSQASIRSMKKENIFSFYRGIEKINLNNLKSYVTSLESYAASSKDERMSRMIGKSIPAGAISCIENRTQEIFGKLNNVGSEEDVMIPVTITGIYILLFEAVTFGIFLFEATRYPRYR